MGAVLLLVIVIVVLGVTINSYWKSSHRREIGDKIDQAKEGLHDVNLEGKLQKVESTLEKAKDKLKSKSEE